MNIFYKFVKSKNCIYDLNSAITVINVNTKHLKKINAATQIVLIIK